MFTGIVEEVGEVVAMDVAEDHARLTVHGPLVTSDAAHGDSISVSGICLTVVDLGEDLFTADLMAETLARTPAGSWRPGTAVNLERSVTPATRLGGHIVQGHVDGVGIVTSRREHGAYDEFAIQVPREIGRFLAEKGAVAVDGISLTVIDVIDDEAGDDTTTFTVGIIPETRTATTMALRKPGDAVTVEADVMAKYADRLLAGRAAQVTGAGV